MPYRFIRARAAALLCAAMLGAVPLAAHAAELDAASLSARLKAMNLPAETVTMGDLHGVDSSFGQDEAFTIYLNGCDANRKNCTTVQFEANFTDSKAGPAEMNAFNAGHRFAHGVIDVTGEPSLRMDLFAGTVSSGEFQQAVDVWRKLMTAFRETIFPS